MNEIKNNSEEIKKEEKPENKLDTKEKKERNPRDLTAGLILIIVGGILILNNLKVLPWSVWLDLLNYWPLLIVLGGLRMILGSSWIGQVSTFIFALLIVTFVGGISFLRANSDLYNNITSQIQSKELKEIVEKIVIKGRMDIITQEDIIGFDNREINQIKYNLILDIGDLDISDENIQEVAILNSNYFKDVAVPNLSQNFQNGILSIDLKTETSSYNGLFDISTWGKIKYHLITNSGIKSDFNLVVKTGSINLKIDEAQINNISAEVSTGSLDLEFSEKSVPESITIDVATGNANIRIPRNVGVLVDYDIATGSFIVDEQNLKGQGTFKAEGYDTKEKKLKINAGMATGNIKIEYLND